MSLFRRRVETPAHVSLEQTEAYFFAHVELGLDVQPGDRVLLHGEAVRLAFGERAEFDRIATVEQAPWWTRAWTRFAGHFGLVHLYEVSFSGRRLP